MITVPCNDGRKFSFEPTRAAFLAIDFQRDFIEPEGGCHRGQPGAERLSTAVPAAKKAVEAARSAGMPIIHTRESYSPDLSDVNPLKRDMGYVGVAGPLGRCLIRGEAGCDFTREMRPKAGEHVVDKAGFSAFYGTDLQEHLTALGVTHLMVTGITYQCCVHSTLRDAVDRGYHCLTIDDACAALEAGLEDAVRLIMRAEGNLFGWITFSDTFIQALASADNPE